VKWEGGLGCKIYFLYNHKQYKIQDLLCIQYITVYFPSTLLLFFGISVSLLIFLANGASASVSLKFFVYARGHNRNKYAIICTHHFKSLTIFPENMKTKLQPIRCLYYEYLFNIIHKGTNLYIVVLKLKTYTKVEIITDCLLNNTNSQNWIVSCIDINLIDIFCLRYLLCVLF